MTTVSATVEPGPIIDPFGGSAPGRYHDSMVEVRDLRGEMPRRSLHMVRTEHFDVIHQDDRVLLGHRVPPERIDDDLSGLLADELFSPGWLRGSELFERLFTGIVLSMGPEPRAAWSRFYRNTLERVEESLTPAGEGSTSSHGTIADYAPVYAIAERALAFGDVLELGCCFGFFSLRLAQAGRRVIATDVNAGSVELLRVSATGLGIALQTQVADAARLPWPDRLCDNVIALHLLEHLEEEHGARVLHEALRVARRRVVVGVPLEDEADETWGHVRTVSLADLDSWGAATGLPYRVWEEHGGWLVVDV